MDKIIIIGASGHGAVIAEAIELNKTHEIHGFIDSFKPAGDKVLGYEIIGNEDLIPNLVSKGINKGIIAIGDNWDRYQMYCRIQKLASDFQFITVIHPSATVSIYATLGKGIVILPSATVNANALIGDFCIINTNASLGHDSVIQDFSSLAPGTTLGGAVWVGEFSAISIGATILQNIQIGHHTVIGAGALVTNNIDNYTVAYGVPAKKIRERVAEDKYLYQINMDNNFKIFTIKNRDDLEGYKKTLITLDPSPFYASELLDTTDMTNHQLCYFVLEKDEKPIILMPFYIRSIIIDNMKTSYKDVISPYGYSGPLFNTEIITEESIKYFWKQADLWYRKEGIVSEFIRFSLSDNNKWYSGELMPSLKNVKGVLIDPEQQWNNFKPKVRNNYRKALQERLKIEIYYNDISKDVIKDFYDIYIQTMQRNNAHSQYFHYIDYFENIISENKNIAIIAMVYKDFKPISVELLLGGDDTLYSYLGGTLSDYFYTRPNDFLKIEVMKWAKTNEYKYYVLGGGREDGDSLYKYKKAFFPNDKDAVYYTGRKVINVEVYNNLVLAKSKKEEGDDASDTMDKAKNHFPLYRHDN